MATIQVRNFYKVAKQIGLKKGEFSAKCPLDKHGEYKDMEVCLLVRVTQEQARQLAKHYEVKIYKRNGKINWTTPHVANRKAKLILVDLDKQDDWGLYETTELEN